MKRILEVKKQIGTLSKSHENPFFKSKYLDLNDLITAVEPLLHEQGLLLIQPINNSTVETQIVDAETGDILLNSCLELPNILDPQKLGSAITYYRRYTLKSLLAIAENDDDGNLAAKPEKPVKPKCSTDLVKKGIEKANGDGDKLNALIDKFDLDDNQLKLINEQFEKYEAKKIAEQKKLMPNG